jgi:hypothetical protein
MLSAGGRPLELALKKFFRAVIGLLTRDEFVERCDVEDKNIAERGFKVQAHATEQLVLGRAGSAAAVA